MQGNTLRYCTDAGVKYSVCNFVMERKLLQQKHTFLQFHFHCKKLCNEILEGL